MHYAEYSVRRQGTFAIRVSQKFGSQGKCVRPALARAFAKNNVRFRCLKKVALTVK